MGINPETALVDYDKLEANAALFRPNVLVCGGSCYPREWDYERLRKIADKHNAYLVCDMAHVSGIVAAQECVSPFDYCDIVTSTTHKTLRGPRAGIIFFRKGSRTNAKGREIKYDLESKINFAVFPSCQGGPHQNAIAAVATALREACTPEFKQYIKDVISNARLMASELQNRGYIVQTGGTDNHIVVWSTKDKGLTGSKVEAVLELCNISVNKNTIVGDTSALSPGGVRLGSSCLTTRKLTTSDFKQVVEFLDRGIQIALKIQEKSWKEIEGFQSRFGRKRRY